MCSQSVSNESLWVLTRERPLVGARSRHRGLGWIIGGTHEHASGGRVRTVPGNRAADRHASAATAERYTRPERRAGPERHGRTGRDPQPGRPARTASGRRAAGAVPRRRTAAGGDAGGGSGEAGGG